MAGYSRTYRAGFPGIFHDDPNFLDGAPIGARLRLNSEGEPDEYEACPDAEVFDWDEARLKAVESYEVKFRSIINGAISRNYAEDVETKNILVKVRRVQERLIRIDKHATTLLQDVSLREVRRAVSAKNSYEQRIGKWENGSLRQRTAGPVHLARYTWPGDDEAD